MATENSQMQVQMLRLMAGPNGIAEADIIASFPIAQARDLITRGFAVAYNPQALSSISRDDFGGWRDDRGNVVDPARWVAKY